MKPIGKDTIGAYYFESEDMSEAMAWSGKHDMLVLGIEEKFRAYDRDTYRGYFTKLKNDTCCICGDRTFGTKRIEIVIVDDIGNRGDRKVGKALFCQTHFRKIMAAAMKDKLGAVN